MQSPPLVNFGFAFLLVFVGATIPAGIYAKTAYGTSLANVDWLHGTAESLLTVTNIFIVLGLRQAIQRTVSDGGGKGGAEGGLDGGAGAGADADRKDDATRIR